MKSIQKIVFAAVIGFLLVSCKDTVKKNNHSKTIQNSSEETEIPAVVEKTETTHFTVNGMSCAVMCAAKIEKELAGQEGVQEAKVDFETKTATVKYDAAKQTPETLIETVEKVGGGNLYKVSDVKTTLNPA